MHGMLPMASVMIHPADYATNRQAVDKAFELLQVAIRGKKVLAKSNVLRAWRPEEGIAIHLAVLRAMVPMKASLGQLSWWRQSRAIIATSAMIHTRSILTRCSWSVFPGRDRRRCFDQPVQVQSQWLDKDWLANDEAWYRNIFGTFFLIYYLCLLLKGGVFEIIHAIVISVIVLFFISDAFNKYFYRNLNYFDCFLVAISKIIVHIFKTTNKFITIWNWWKNVCL